ncbi:3-phenylpropionate/trans-cinnamate dioxygenase ferredoxin reductase subunit [Pseudorhizobium tarimense]|uniref:3-phenylpropionate/trans-cinnamate dioxygenase ferredoxin reductase subunit n=1 Tax=Pseudorhizobium tarimense TaxID=1079109 RepID=A0ABV2HBQ9_9HYPH|nr:FAD-dependent oxidoreductase [Pseudorhizobium tarimense]MCJ8520914.1 FAD-dependent oxidoreductase [Pseudorhizobium tarimense]
MKRDRHPGVVVIGASHAGLAVAAELRKLEYLHPITLISDEVALPYHRPHLSKECISGQMPVPRDLRPLGFFAENDIDLRLNSSVVAIERNLHQVRLSFENLPYENLIIATGADARRLPEAIDPEGHAITLRVRADWEILSVRLRRARHIVVIGGGLIGLEVAAAACALGAAVTVIEAAGQLMARSLYLPLAEEVLQRHTANGINFRLNARVASVGSSGITLEHGERIDADLVVAAVGSSPRCDLAVEAGLACSDGIETDAQGRTADPVIFALGDCARWSNSGRSERHESVAASQAQAKAVAAAITGVAAPPNVPLRLWSTQGEIRLQMSGPVKTGCKTHLEQVEESGLLLRAVEDGRLIAVQALDAARSFSSAVSRIGEIESPRDASLIANCSN